MRFSLVAALAFWTTLSSAVVPIFAQPDPSPRKTPGILELHAKLKPGMTRPEVDAILGPPRSVSDGLNGETSANYLGQEYCERIMSSLESPFLPAGIYVTFSGGRVAKTSYNTQWVKRPAWGDAVGGIQYGVELKERAVVRLGESITLQLKARNVTKSPSPSKAPPSATSGRCRRSAR